MNEDPDSKQPSPPHGVAVEKMQAGRNALAIGWVKNLIINGGEPAAEPSQIRSANPPPLAPGQPAPAVLHPALTALHQPETCVYLGCRYGLTPHSPVSAEFLASRELGIEPPKVDSLSAAMGWLAGQIGMTAARRHLAEHYASLDEVAPEVAEELDVLASLAAGRTLVTGSYSAQIQNALGPALTVIHCDPQVDRGWTQGRSKRAHLLMLHGSEQDFQNALVAEDDVLSYSQRCPALAEAVSNLLSSTWFILGAEQKADTTFRLLVRHASVKLGAQPPPIFVVDPRPENEVANDWPRAALRHVCMTPSDFLSRARGDR